MNPDFQQAIEMTRSGDRIGAQKKVADILKEDPNDAHAWYLLSLLVNSDQKRAVYLSKVVSLDPNHEKAIEQLSILEQTSSTATPITSGNNYDLMEQEKADTIPDWMSDTGEPTLQPDTAVTETIAVEDEEEPVPDWVQEDVSASWVEEDNSLVTSPPTAVVEKTTPPPAKKAPSKQKATKKKPAKKQKKKQQYDIALIGLIIFALIVGLLLVGYVLF